MAKVKGLFKRLVDKDVQTLYEADFLDGDLALTEEGQEELLHILFDQHKIELVKRAQEVLKDRKKNKKDEDDLEEI